MGRGRVCSRRAATALSLGAVLVAMAIAVGVASGAGGEGPVTVKVGDGLPVVSASFSPKALSRTGQTPVTLSIEAAVEEEDGSPPPALREISIEADKAVEVHTKGIPVCHLGIQVDATTAAGQDCGPALIGTGTATAEIAFAEDSPRDVDSNLRVFNGGESGSETKLFVKAHFSAPISGTIVIPVTVTKHRNGRFGTRAVARIPQLAGGSGSVTQLGFRIDDVDGGNPISAGCRDGKLEVHSEARFEDGTRTHEEIVRACTPIG